MKNPNPSQIMIYYAFSGKKREDFRWSNISLKNFHDSTNYYDTNESVIVNRMRTDYNAIPYTMYDGETTALGWYFYTPEDLTYFILKYSGRR